MRIFKEIHRRSLWQILGIYVALSWLALQVVDVLTDNFGLPDWFPPLSLGLLVIGLPIVLTTAFVQRGGPTARALRGGGARPFADPTPASVGAREPATSQGAVEPRAASAGGAAPDGVHHHLFTWRNASMGGLLAFAVIGVLAVGWIASRALGVGPAATLVAQGVLEERARILIADFESPSGDTDLARTATEAFRIDFGQSTAISVVQPTEITGALQRMSREPDEPLDGDLAREVAIREGIPAVVVGDVNTAGGSFVFSAQLISVEDGVVLVPVRETAADSNAIIKAIDDLSASLRERIGDRLGQLRDEAPLEQVSTPSLAALEKFSQGTHTIEVLGDVDLGLALLDEAVGFDPEFAMAWRKIGTMLGNRGQERARQVEALTNAFEHRDRLTENERYHAEAIYYFYAAGEPENALNAYRTLVRLYPEDDAAKNNIGVMHMWLRDHEAGLAAYDEAWRADTTGWRALTNKTGPLVKLGDIEGARAVVEETRRRFPDVPEGLNREWRLAGATGDFEAAREAVLERSELMRGTQFGRWLEARNLADLAAIEGKLEEAARYTDAAMEVQEQRGLIGDYLIDAVDLAQVYSYAAEDRDRATRVLDEALSRHPLDEMEPLDRPTLLLARAYASARDLDRATELLTAFESEVPPEIRDPFQKQELDLTLGTLALAEGRLDDAISDFRRADRGFSLINTLRGLARAYEAVGMPDSAAATYARYVETDDIYRAFDDRWHLGPSLERAAQLHDELGDPDRAIEFYARFVDLWADADEVLQPRVTAAQARLQELVEARG